MYKCRNCGETYQSYVGYCGRCGGTVEQISSNISPVYQPEKVYSPAPSRGVAGRGKGITSLIFGIGSMSMVFISFVYSIAAMVAAFEFADTERTITRYSYGGYYSSSYSYTATNPSYWSNHEAWIALLTVSYIFTGLLLIFSIIGLILGKSSRNLGYISGISKTGTVLSLISVIFGCISLSITVLANIIPM